tara:strand:+ start:38 stop:994 length:957 start_codon:yes stop_codon:yes gene_type:complete
MKRHYRTMVLRSSTDRSGRTTVIASTPTPDRYNDVVDSEWNLEHFKSNPVVVWAHDYTLPPVGRVVDIDIEGKNLVASIEWDDSESNPLGKTVASQFKRGFLNAVSVGFTPGETIERSKLPDDHPAHGATGYWYTKSELQEISAVPIPANRDAVAIRAANQEYAKMSEIQKQASMEVDAPDGYHWMDYEGGPVLMAGDSDDHEGASMSFDFEVIEDHDPDRLRYMDDDEDENKEHEPEHDEDEDEDVYVEADDDEDDDEDAAPEEEEDDEDEDEEEAQKHFRMSVRRAVLDLMGTDPALFDTHIESTKGLNTLFGIDK